MSREYCLKTPKSKMGFSQKASCKSQGYIARTSRKYNGRYMKSSKYVKSSRRKSRKHIDSGINKSLYNNGTKNPRVITGYGTKEKAKQTIKNIKRFPLSYQKQVVNTMYNRAKYHANQTQEMRDAMKIYKEWNKKHKSR